MKITLEVGEDLLRCVDKQLGCKDVESVAAFVRSAIESELVRIEHGCPSEETTSLAVIAEEIDKLRQSQQVLFILVDRAVTVLARKHYGK